MLQEALYTILGRGSNKHNRVMGVKEFGINDEIMGEASYNYERSKCAVYHRKSPTLPIGMNNCISAKASETQEFLFAVTVPDKQGSYSAYEARALSMKHGLHISPREVVAGTSHSDLWHYHGQSLPLPTDNTVGKGLGSVETTPILRCL